MAYPTTPRLLLTIALALALGSLLAVPASAASLAELMRNSGIKYSGPDSNGVYQVEYDGDNVPLIQVNVALAGEGTFQTVCLFSRVIKVDDVRKWDVAVFPWLLERPGELPHGSFLLADEGRQVIYLDRFPLSGLDSASLGKFIALAVLVVDDTYPKLKNYVKG